MPIINVSYLIVKNKGGLIENVLNIDLVASQTIKKPESGISYLRMLSVNNKSQTRVIAPFIVFAKHLKTTILGICPVLIIS